MVVRTWLRETFHKAKTIVVPTKKATTNGPDPTIAAFSQPEETTFPASIANGTFMSSSENEAASHTTVKTPEHIPATVEETDNKVVTTAINPCHVTASSSALSSQIWFRTSALDQELLNKLAEIQLQTTSHDQGWVDLPGQGSFSWFDIIILESPEASKPKVVDGRELVWQSHTNNLGSREQAERWGTSFNREHDIVKNLEAGNVLAVRVCAQYGGWENHASEGRLTLKFDV